MAIECITLTDASSGATVKIAVGFGFNCFQFRVERNRRSLDILWSDPAFANGSARASSSGIPILFPFPGRIPQGVLNWEGKEYRLPAGDGRGNAIHGFVLDRPWRVTQRNDHQVVGEFHASRDDAKILELWPADFRIRVTYSLRRDTLSCAIEVENPDSKPLPFGLGTHPYFRVSLGGKRRDECQVIVPVAEEWELKELLPTGRRMALANAKTLQQGMRFGEMQFDHVLTGLIQQDGWYRSAVVDSDANVRVEQNFDRAFRECVLYTPGHRGAVCIEPYTCVPGPFGLQERGIDAGLRVLQPGEKFTAQVEIVVE